MQEALVQAALTWPDRPPPDPTGWLVTVAWRRFLDVRRSEASRRDREQRVEVEPPPGPTERDPAAEVIRLTRQLASMTDDEETAGLLALMLRHHARRSARGPGATSAWYPLAEQDRSQWSASLIAEGVAVLQTALGRDRCAPCPASRPWRPWTLACPATPPPRRTSTRRRAIF